MKKILQIINVITSFLSSSDNSNQGRDLTLPPDNTRVLCPKDYKAYFFKNVIVIAKSQNEAKGKYIYMLKREVNLSEGKKITEDAKTK